MSFEEGAALTNVGVTAYGALRTAEFKAGETVVVLGATGGVGSAGVQIAKAIGCRVLAVVSTARKAERLQHLGADHVLALSDGPLAEQVQELTEGKGADVVLAANVVACNETPPKGKIPRGIWTAGAPWLPKGFADFRESNRCSAWIV
jgi:NADPH:quinone reductase-like Zn-dependent oxidoreductase